MFWLINILLWLLVIALALFACVCLCVFPVYIHYLKLIIGLEYQEATTAAAPASATEEYSSLLVVRTDS